MSDLANRWRALMAEWPQFQVGYKTSPLPSAYDDTITNLVRSFRQSGREEREAVQKAIQAERVTPLVMYAERMASLALKDKDASRIADGLVAIAMQGHTPDPRDSLYGLALLYASAHKLGQDAQVQFDAAAALASPEAADALLRFTRERPPAARTLQAFGFREVHDPTQALPYREDR